MRLLKNNLPAITRSTLGVVLLAVLPLILGGSVVAQTTSGTDGSTPSGLKPGAAAGSYSLSGFENINLFNGNLNVRLPLMSIGGRGGAHTTMMLPFNTKRWHVENYESEFYSSHTAQASWWSAHVGYGPGVLQGRHGAYQTRVCHRNYEPYETYNVNKNTYTTLTFTGPDGSEYELRDQLTNGQPLTSTACNTSQGPSRGTVFISSQGEAVTFISDQTIYDYIDTDEMPLFPSGLLLMRDGTRYRIDDGHVSWIRDRNGNKMSFSYDLNGRVTTITDSLNRQVTVEYDVNDAAPYGLCDRITFKGAGGQTRTIRVAKTAMENALRSGYSIQTMAQLFPGLGSSGLYNPTVPWKVWLPNSDNTAQHYQFYQFFYNSYGELARIELPTGGAIEYDMTPGSGIVGGDPWEIYRRLVERRVYADGTTLENRTTYDVVQSSWTDPWPWTTTVTEDQLNSQGTLLARSKHYFNGSGLAVLIKQNAQDQQYIYAGWSEGQEYQTETFAADGTTVLRRVNTTFQQRASVSWWALNPGREPANDPRLTQTVSTLVDSNQVSQRTFNYDQFNNQTDAYDYDFGSGAPGALVRRSHTDYLTTNSVNATDYTATNVYLLGLPAQTSVYDGNDVEKARATFEYDNYVSDANHASLVYRSSISGLDSSFTTSFTPRGNATATSRYLLVNGSVTGSVSAFVQYDMAGNVVKTIDARGYATTLDFSDRFGAPDGEARANAAPAELSTPGQYSYAFPTLVTNALGHTAYAQFDYYLGAPVDGEDSNGVVASGYYVDPLDRPTRVISAANDTTVKSQATFAYDDANRSITTTSDQTTFNDNVLKSQALYDGLGRTVESRQFEGGSNYIAAQTQYDALGRAFKTSNPFRPWNSETAIWTTTGFDALGRVVSVTTPDSAVVTSAYSGNTVTVTDQTGKARRSVTDGLGRLARVDEPDSNGNLGTTASPAQPTSYSYDTLDNLTSVNQGSQTRSFVYDSLKRLASATNPESGTICYGTVVSGQCQADGYDAIGNLRFRTDARGISTEYRYDALNRVTVKLYRVGGQPDPNTGDVEYLYDNATNGKGRLWLTLTWGANRFQSVVGNYDALGRITQFHNIFGNGQGGWYPSYDINRTYDLAGHVLTETYPSGRIVTNAYDSGGRTTSVTGNLGDGTTRTYSTGISYSALGGMTQEQFGTATPVYNKLFYNSRGQLAEILAGTTGNDTSWNRGKIVNDYSGADNNGNLKKQTVFIPNNEQNTSSTSWYQQYEYDSLNRLTQVHEHASNTNLLWQQQFVYDRYGNRTIDYNNTSSGIPRPQFIVNTATNRLGVPNGEPGAMTYDTAGNLTTDTYSGAGVTRAYDAENRMTQETQANSYVAGTYSYDGDGRRVKRAVAGPPSSVNEVWQVYGIGGELVAEYAAGGAAASPQKEYGYRNGQLLVTATVTTGWGSPPTLHDNPLVVAETTVQARHVTELRDGINSLRTHMGMSAYSWQYSATTSDYISANPILEMRTALDQALGAPSPSYAAGLSQGQQIKAIHIQELRDRVLAAWVSSGSTDIRWIVADQLGTPRMIFDPSGSLANTSRHDYLPFGEELSSVVGLRSSSQGYTNADGARQKFTEYERDNETGLDFAQARYYSNTQGRFTGVDPLSGQLADPQSWNRYTYVLNNPLNLTDPTGMAVASHEIQTTFRQKDAGVYGNMEAATFWDSGMDLWFDMENELAAKEAASLARGNVVAVVNIYGNFEDTWGNPDYAAMSAALWGLARNGMRFGAPSTSGPPSQFRNFLAGVIDNGVGPPPIFGWSLGRVLRLGADWMAGDYADEDSTAYYVGSWVPDVVAAVAGAGAMRSLQEITIRGVRIAPFGNATKHPIGRFPHYHRRGLGPNGLTRAGQGIGRHRPWESSRHDTRWWHRF